MSHKYEFISMESILAKHHRDLRGLDVHETDAIEWAGEALGFMKIPNVAEEKVIFLQVKNYEAELPAFLHYILQIARHTGPLSEEDRIALQKSADSKDQINLQYDYTGWQNFMYNTRAFTPVRLADHTFFNSIVCREQDSRIKELYNTCRDEYTVVQTGFTRKVRFSFESGYVALAYAGQRCDENTGYPMVPDNEYCTSAINYYMTWKLMERYCWLGRQGACDRADRAMALWDKYISKFKNHAMMPYGADQLQNLADQGNYLIPRRRVFDNFFGNMANREIRAFKYDNPFIGNSTPVTAAFSEPPSSDTTTTSTYVESAYVEDGYVE